MKTSFVKAATAGFLSLSLAVAAMLPDWNVTQAASHCEAPLTALYHKADITDYYAFVSYDDPNKVTLVLSVDRCLNPRMNRTTFRSIQTSAMPSKLTTITTRWRASASSFSSGCLDALSPRNDQRAACQNEGVC